MHLFDGDDMPAPCDNLRNLQNNIDDGCNRSNENPVDLQRSIERDAPLAVLYAEINRIPFILSEKNTDESFAHAQLTYYLGALYNILFARTQADTVLDDTIRVYRQSISLLPQDHRLRFHLLVDLGNVLHHRYRSAKRLQDIEESVEAFRTAFAMCPEDHLLRPYILDSLGCTVTDRSRRMVLLFHFQKAKSLACLETAINSYKEMLGLFASKDPRRFPWLIRTSDCLEIRYAHTGDAATVEDNLGLCNEAVSLAPAGHPHRPAALGRQAAALMSQLDPDSRVLTTAALPAVDAIIHVMEECTHFYLTGDNGPHPDYGNAMNHLADAVKVRASITNNCCDWEKSILIRKQAL
jgi:tetratricopeptide (TPR) repeat protein